MFQVRFGIVRTIRGRVSALLSFPTHLRIYFFVFCSLPSTTRVSPVHSWCVKHLYAPLLRAGATPTMAMFCVFFFSAVMHEVLISVPCHAFYWYGFAAMFGQIPIILLQKVVHRYLPLGTNDWVGNVSFWLTFCIFGQPIVMLLYMHQFAKASTIASA
jgi:hypothetical protein